MPTIDILNTDKKKVGSLELRADVFAVDVNFPLVHQVIKAQLANARQGTAKTKVKSEVRGGGRKPFRQKGTGNARQGSTRSPLMPGGGSAFGPVPRSYRQYTPKEMVRGALRSLLTDRLNAQHILVLDQIPLTQAKTKDFAAIVNKKLNLNKALIVDMANEKLERSGRNVKNVKVLRVEMLNAYDVAKHEWIVFTQKAIENIQSRLAPEA